MKRSIQLTIVLSAATLIAAIDSHSLAGWLQIHTNASAIRSCLCNFSADEWFLKVPSLAFCLGWSMPCIFLTLFTSLLDYSIARKLDRTAHPSHHRRLLVISLIAYLGLPGLAIVLAMFCAAHTKARQRLIYDFDFGPLWTCLSGCFVVYN
jgi:hypothetical protein